VRRRDLTAGRAIARGERGGKIGGGTLSTSGGIICSTKNPR
jgi:hypothetical protein